MLIDKNDACSYMSSHSVFYGRETIPLEDVVELPDNSYRLSQLELPIKRRVYAARVCGYDVCLAFVYENSQHTIHIETAEGYVPQYHHDGEVTPEVIAEIMTSPLRDGDVIYPEDIVKLPAISNETCKSCLEQGVENSDSYIKAEDIYAARYRDYVLLAYVSADGAILCRSH